MQIEDILRRIWDGKRGLHGLGVDPELKNVRIVVGANVWPVILTAGRKLPFASGAISETLEVEGPVIRIFGLVTDVDYGLDTEDIRFRSEVSL